MKSEEEIRKYVVSMEASLNTPCSCDASGHQFQCHVGGMMTRATISALKWVMGENPTHDKLVKTFNDAMDRAKANRN